MFRQFFAAAVFVAAISISTIFAQSDPKATPTPTPEPKNPPVTVGPAHRNLPIQKIDPTQLLTTQVNGYIRPDAKLRFKRYVNGIVGPVALARQVARAGISTWQNSPEEWGPH